MWKKGESWSHQPATCKGSIDIIPFLQSFSLTLLGRMGLSPSLEPPIIIFPMIISINWQYILIFSTNPVTGSPNLRIPQWSHQLFRAFCSQPISFCPSLLCILQWTEAIGSPYNWEPEHHFLSTILNKAIKYTDLDVFGQGTFEGTTTKN